MREFRTAELGMVALLVMGVAGCGGEPRDETAALVVGPSTGGTAIVAIADEPDVLNSLVRTSAVAGMVLSLVQAPLAEVGEDMEYFPMIADSWELAPDSLAITYHLRPWRWQDGVPLTAGDVQLSYELFRDPLIASPRADLLRAVTSCAALDSATVRYAFAAPQPDPLQSSSHSLLPAHRVGGLDRRAVGTWDVNRAPLASGPFILTAWEPARQLILEPNPAFPLARPWLDRVVLRILPDATARVLALEVGEVDLVADVSASTARRLADHDFIALYGVESRVFGLVMWNLRRPVLEDADVRRALSLAMDRERLVADLLGGFGEPAASYLPPLLWNHHPTLAPDPCLPDSARALLAAAGWIDADGDGFRERDGVPLRLDVLYRGGDAEHDNGAALLRQSLRAVGVDCDLRSLELATAQSFLRAGRFDAYLGEFQANLYADPSALVGSGASDRFNFGGYANARVDSLLTAALAETDRARSLPLWYALQAELATDQPAAVLYYRRQVVAVNRRVRDVRPHVLGPLNNIAEWWIAPADRHWASDD